MKWQAFIEHPRVVKIVDRYGYDPGESLFQIVSHDTLRQMTDLLRILELAEEANLLQSTFGWLDDRRPHLEAWTERVSEITLRHHQARPPDVSWPELLAEVGKVPVREQVSQMLETARKESRTVPATSLAGMLYEIVLRRLAGLLFLIDSIRGEEYVELWKLRTGQRRL